MTYVHVGMILIALSVTFQKHFDEHLDLFIISYAHLCEWRHLYESPNLEMLLIAVDTCLGSYGIEFGGMA